jgi:hypothetical protein
LTISTGSILPVFSFRVGVSPDLLGARTALNRLPAAMRDILYPREISLPVMVKYSVDRILLAPSCDSVRSSGGDRIAWALAEPSRPRLAVQHSNRSPCPYGRSRPEPATMLVPGLPLLRPRALRWLPKADVCLSCIGAYAVASPQPNHRYLNQTIGRELQCNFCGNNLRKYTANAVQFSPRPHMLARATNYESL